MRARAIADLTQLVDTTLFPAAARGLRLILANALNLWRGASFGKRAGYNQGAIILRGLAEEEAAKFHILLDAIRCPSSQRLGEHLRRHFYDHLARGIYVRHYELSPHEFADVKRIVNDSRVALYLDGPEGFEWIFRNQILERREQEIYVDYVQSETDHFWSKPVPDLLFPANFVPKILAVARSLARAGIATPCGLKVVATTWRTFVIEDVTTWSELREKNFETLKALETNQCLRPVSNDVVDSIIDGWSFPLYSLDLTEDRSVGLNELRRVRSEAEVRWMEQEFGYPDY
jgi:AbiV family abortive infection protein